jgi:SAM-dependent methyltransferase
VAATGARALEVGADARNGGISLWLAAKGFDVVCSGLEEPSATMLRLHADHGLADRISYERIDVLDIPHEEAFDVVVFKSLLGFFGMSDGDTNELQRTAVTGMHKALKPGGELWFAENAAGTPAHAKIRDRFRWGAKGWHYVRPDEVTSLMSVFDRVDFRTLGVSGALGRSERQRRALAMIDRAVLEPLTPTGWRYVITGVAHRDAVPA